MTQSTTSSTRSGMHRIGTDADGTETRPVRAQDRAVIGVFADVTKRGESPPVVSRRVLRSPDPEPVA